MPVVLSLPQRGQIAGSPVLTCPVHGLVVVTLQYGPGADAHDGDVNLVPAPSAKAQVGNVFCFTITEEDQYEARVTSATWSVAAQHTYEAYAELDHHTSVVIPLHVHTVTITAQEALHFVPGLDTVWFDYAITGDPGTVARLDFEVFQGAVQVSTHAVAAPFAANGRTTWTPALGLRLIGNPYTPSSCGSRATEDACA